MAQGGKTLLLRWQLLVTCLVLILAFSASAVDVGGEDEDVVEISLPDVMEELPEPESVLEGDCLNISLKNNDWSWDDEESQDEEGETLLLVKTLLKRLNNETGRIHMQNPNLNLTHFVRLVASRSSLQVLKIKSFARIFGQINALYGYTCRNGKQLLRHALQRNVTDEELEELDEEIMSEIDSLLDGEAEDDEGGNGDVRTGTGIRGNQNKTMAARKRNRAAVKMFMRRAVIAMFLSPRRVRGQDVPRLSDYITKLASIGTLGALEPSQSEEATNGDGTGGAVSADGASDGVFDEGEFEAWREVLESAEWFNGYDDEMEFDDDETRKRFSFEGYLFKLMSSHVNKSASCARNVTRFIKKHTNRTMSGMPNITDSEGDVREVWNEWVRVMRHLNKTRDRNFTSFFGGGFSGGSFGGGFFGGGFGGGFSGGHGGQGEPGQTTPPTANPLDETEDLIAMARNLTRRLAKGRWIGDGGIEGSFYVVLMKLTSIIDSWGRAGFLSNGTYFDATCTSEESKLEGATTSCNICPTDSAFRNLKMLLAELDDAIRQVYDGIKKGVDRMTAGPEKEQLQVYRLPRLVLAETQFTLSDDEKCTPFTLTFNIPQPQGGGKQTQPPGTDGDEEEEEEEEGGTDDDSETTTVISYEDFSALRMAQFSLPPLPFVLGAQDSKVLQGKTKRFKIDSTSFESDNQLMIEGRFCDMKSRILELCLSFNGHTRIRTRDAPEGKCHNITVYSDAPALSSARLSDAGDSVVIFFNKGVSAGKELRECSAIFDDATLELFGENAQCQWRSGNLELVVRLGKSSTIATGSQITLRDDRIRAFKERFSHTASGSFDVHAPNKPVTPRALIDGEPKVPDCGSVKLSALRSEGGGSRGLTYTWSLESPTENVDGGITKLLRKANNGNKAVLVIPASLLPEVTPYEWGLTVMNVLDHEDSTTFTVRKANAREPNFEIRTNGIPKKGAVKITSAVSLVGDISFNRPGCPKETASEVQFQWSISGAEFEEGVLTTDKRILKFPRRSLPADADIEANLTVTYGTEDVTLTRTVTFTTANEPLVARIKGGERTTTGVASDEFTLDCSLSRDPNYQGDGPDEGLNFEWTCWQETDKEKCYYNDPEGETIQLPTMDQGSDGPILTVVPSTLTAGKVYSFSCDVGKEEMGKKHDSVTIEVTENNPPRISLSLIKSKNKAYRPGRDVEIRAVVDGDDISEMTWEDIGGGLDGFGEDALTLIQDTTVDEEEETTLTTSEDADTDKPYTITISKKMGKYIVLLRINKDQLQAGSEYEMQFSALNGEELGSSTIGFEVGAKVTGCQFEFGGNDSYVDTATDVTYAVEACASEGEETLNYQAFASFPVDGKKPQMKFLGRTSEYPEIEVDHEVFDRIKRKVEAEEEVSFQVGMRVCYQDTRVCSIFKKDVTYIHQALTEEEVDAKKEEINDLKKEGKSVEALKAANSVQNARADQTVEGERKRRATVSFDTELLGLQKELLLLATGDSSNFDGYPGDIQSMADAAIDVPIEAFQREEMREILEADKNVLEAAKDLDDPLPQDTLDGIRQHLEDAKMAFPDTKFFTENREILGLLSKCMSKNLATGERVTSYGDDILITIEATLNIDPISIPMGDGDISFNGGDDVRNRYDASWEGCGCEECVGVLVEFFIYRGQDYVAGESHDSDVIGLRFISPCTGEAMTVEDLIDPITMSVPFTSPLLNTTNPICSFYNESLMTWSQRGVATRVHGMDVVCETNHTTEYVIDFTDEDGAMAEPTTTMTWGGEVSTRDHGDEDDDDDDDGNIPGLNGLLGLGIGVIAGIVVASLVVLAVIIILLAVVIKNMNKPKVIVEPVIDIKA